MALASLYRKSMSIKAWAVSEDENGVSGWNGHEGCCVFRAPFDCSGLTSRGIFKPEGSGSNPRIYKNIYTVYALPAAKLYFRSTFPNQ